MDTDSIATTFETIHLSSGAAHAFLAPARGGMVTRFFVAGRPVLYLDEGTLTDETKNVSRVIRCSSATPSAWPTRGRPLCACRQDRRDEATRIRACMLGRGPSRRPPARRRPSSSRRTKRREASYPWNFALKYRYSLSDAELRIDQHVANRSPDPMPFAAGFHPYFYVRDADKKRARVPTNATRGWDNVAKRVVAIGPIDLTVPEVDLHLFDHAGPEATLELTDEGVDARAVRIAVRASKEYSRWFVWTLAGKDFICLEPWTAPSDALNTGDHLIEVPPGGAVDLFVSIAVW